MKNAIGHELCPELMEGLGIQIKTEETKKDTATLQQRLQKNGKLEKRAVVLGEYDFMTDAMEILEGLTEGDYIAFPDPEFCAEGVSTTKAVLSLAKEKGVTVALECHPNSLTDEYHTAKPGNISEKTAVKLGVMLLCARLLGVHKVVEIAVSIYVDAVFFCALRD